MGHGAVDIDNVGIIELKVELVRYAEPKRPKNNRFFARDNRDGAFAQRIVHETSKKLGGHQASCVDMLRCSLLLTLRRLGEELPARQGSRYNSSWKPPKKRLPYDPDDDQPYVVFKFAYAPRGTCRSVPYATTEGVQKFCWRRVSYLRSNWPQHPRRTQPGHLPHNLHRQQPCFEKTLRWLISRSIPSPNVPKQSQT